MEPFPRSFSLAGKRGVVVGVANASSIAWGCAKAMHGAGAEVALSYLNEKARPHVQPLAESIGAAASITGGTLHVDGGYHILG